VSASVLASLPSPADGNVELGPISLHVYGMLLAIGVVVAVKVTTIRWSRRGRDPNEIVDIALVGIVAGVVGARLYHVATDYQRFTDGRWIDAVKVWQGGLSIWGAVAGGGLAVAVVARRRHLRALALTDCVVPGLFLAQAIGRWGNWFNQELFGRPTDLPWGLEISPGERPDGYERYDTFHPTFLYESLYCLLGAWVLVRIDRRGTLARGQLTALYVAGYAFGRFFIENLRIDEAHRVLGRRVNAWVSLVVLFGGLAWFAWLHRHGEPADAPPARAVETTP
jgi:prolipoprotein diacylglyceryl transferase